MTMPWYLFRDIIGLTPDNMDSIGNMKVQIKDIWFSNEYMNVRFMLNFPNPQKAYSQSGCQ